MNLPEFIRTINDAQRQFAEDADAALIRYRKTVDEARLRFFDENSEQAKASLRYPGDS